MKSKIDENHLIDKRQEIGEKIKRFREAKGLSQQQLSEEMGVSRSTISKIEDGKWNFGIDTLNVFSVYLGFKVDLN